MERDEVFRLIPPVVFSSHLSLCLDVLYMSPPFWDFVDGGRHMMEVATRDDEHEFEVSRDSDSSNEEMYGSFEDKTVGTKTLGRGELEEGVTGTGE